MLVFVKAPNGDSIKLEVQPTDSVDRLKLLVSDGLGVAPDEQIFEFSGMRLDSDHCLGDYNIQNESTLQLVISFLPV